MAARKQEVEAKLPLEEDGYEENDTGYVVTHRNPTEESEHFRKRCFLGRRFLGSCFFRSASGRVKATFSPPSLSSDSLGTVHFLWGRGGWWDLEECNLKIV